MILVRDVFRLKFGKAREAVEVFQGLREHARKAGWEADAIRLLTDLVGPYYTLVLETTAPDLASYEQRGKTIMADAEWRARYQQFTPLVESGYREIFNIVS